MLELLLESVPVSSMVVGLAMVPILLGSLGAALGVFSKRLDALWQGIGLVPAVILALLFAAYVEVTYGALSLDGWPAMLRILLAAVVLGVADGALASAVMGTRSVFQEEVKQRYVQMALLRGESVLSNALPNVLPALVGQMRSRVLHILSGAVIVEVVLGIPGLGQLLWDGTLLQDFGVVLAAGWGFSLLSGAMLLVQAVFEIGIAMYVRYSPKVQM
ncbi:MAG: ABC transporter permease subunit [Deltaproteobacteria bacterium]|nr:ABC transporter permease subunit [Deltaproteobacteria bacterium]